MKWLILCAAWAVFGNVAVAEEDCCEKSQTEINVLKVRVSDLEKKIQDLERRLNRGDSKNSQKPMTSEEQRQIRELMEEAKALKNQGKAKAAIAKLKKVIEISPKYARRIDKQIQELEVIGTSVEGKLDVDRWLTAKKEGRKINLSKGVTVLVFWELWCPHCKREIPNLNEVYKALQGSGLQLVGLTTLSRNKTEADVSEFLKERQVNYPNAVHNGKINVRFNVSGIPAAAVVKEGVIVWRGHPASLHREALLSFLNQ